MQPAQQAAWLDRVRSHMAARTTDMAEDVARVDVARYIDPQRLTAEQALLRRSPIAVTFASKLAKPGDYVTHDLLGLPILLLRDTAGQLQAFLNVCRHRGAKLVWDRGGCGKRAFTCPYHAWSYDLTGKLRGIPHEAGFAGIDRAQHNLVRLPVAQAFGLVFVLPEPHDGYDFSGFLAGVREDLESFGLGSHVLHDEREIGLKCNWKVVIEGGLETYHVPFAHKTTIAPMFADNVAVADRLDPHARLYFTKRNAAELVEQGVEGRNLRDYGNPLYYIFPNLIILVQPDHATVMTVFPQGTDACSVHGGALIPQPPATEKAEAYWDRNVKIFWDALDEDFQMGQAIQAGFRSGANTHVTFGRFEQACAWFHDSLDRRLAATS
ncbi:MAG: aromatic ring-hydroxylating dioxygenase subunit alpha [Ferrovibrio sp.]|uniref:aromatic ring-hydroxylating oxygenase subunit alpha n=1 Tax=Ferrovibrio sp. TaxID=1917215 RepID=UPI00260D055E|nr:aromatic ring-hydroxylating dioxygenase subunit alpha [Ferrovibrio sp.]MCW0232172.1 aromatic ring-hydroxylating dioxygenase subunit alpha [Ferrovibrio sp.]